jgi:hypothetical protein
VDRWGFEPSPQWRYHPHNHPFLSFEIIYQRNGIGDGFEPMIPTQKGDALSVLSYLFLFKP